MTAGSRRWTVSFLLVALVHGALLWRLTSGAPDHPAGADMPQSAILIDLAPRSGNPAPPPPQKQPKPSPPIRPTDRPSPPQTVPDQPAPQPDIAVAPVVGQPVAPIPAPPLPGVPAGDPSSDHPPNWQQEVLDRLERFKQYPAPVRLRHQQGIVYLRFSMDRAGTVLTASIEKSSGVVLLDAETLALVHRAEPLPVPPPSIAGAVIELVVPVEFSLKH